MLLGFGITRGCGKRFGGGISITSGAAEGDPLQGHVEPRLMRTQSFTPNQHPKGPIPTEAPRQTLATYLRRVGGLFLCILIRAIYR